jgi:quinol monooxygenase YgiN
VLPTGSVDYSLSEGEKMVIELMRISVPRGRKQEFAKALASLVSPTQAQPGCVSCQLFQAWPRPNRLRIETRWESQEYLAHYLRSQAYKQLVLMIELSAAPPIVEFFNVVEIRGLDLVEDVRTSSE